MARGIFPGLAFRVSAVFAKVLDFLFQNHIFDEFDGNQTKRTVVIFPCIFFSYKIVHYARFCKRVK